MAIAKKAAKRVVAKKAAAKKGGAKKAPPKKPAKKPAKTVVKAAKPVKAPARKAAPVKAAPAKVHVVAKPVVRASNGCAERCRVCGDACLRPGLHEQHRCGVHVGMIA